MEMQEMAQYKHGEYLSKGDSEEYDKDYGPGVKVPNSGIYRCQGCGREIAANEGGDPFPAQNRHQHTAQQGTIRWRLLVFAQN
jgi:hypothetical protein